MMNTIILFRFLGVLQIVLFFATYDSWWISFESKAIQDAVAWRGTDAWWIMPREFSIPLDLILVASYIGMIFFARPARFIVTILTILYCLYSLFGGLSVDSGVGNLLGALYGYTFGAFLVLSYVEPCASKFLQSGSAESSKTDSQEL